MISAGLSPLPTLETDPVDAFPEKQDARSADSYCPFNLT